MLPGEEMRKFFKWLRIFKEMAAFYNVGITSILATWLFNPKEFARLQEEMEKFQNFTSSKWEKYDEI